MTLATGLTPGAATALGGGFFNAFSTTDTDPAWVTLHGAGRAVGGGDIWGTVASAASDPNQSGSPGGLRLWQPGHGKAKSFACLGFTWSYVTAGRCYAYHGSGAPGSSANSGFLGYSNDYGLTWTEVSTGNAPSNYQQANPRAVGQTVIARAVSGKDQLVAASWDGVYVTQDVTAGGTNGGFTQKALAGLTCVGLARDPNNPDIVYVAARATVSGALKPGIWKVSITTAGVVSSATLLQGLSCQEVLAINEGGTTAVYGVGNGGVFRVKNGNVTNITGNAPNGVYSAVHGFAASGSTVLAVGNMGAAGSQILWTRFTSANTGAPSWTALDTAARIPSYKVWGQFQAGDLGYWGFGPNGKAGAFALGKGGTFVPSQIICIPNGSTSADIYCCGRTTTYGLIDVVDPTETWWIMGKGTNATQAMTVSASPKGGAKFAHGDFDFLITTTEDGYTTAQPRVHQPWNAYFFCSFYDEQGGVYFGGSPSGSYKNINGGKLSYHPAPHDHSYGTGAGAWINYTGIGNGNRIIGVCGFYSSTNTRVMLATVYGDKTYRRVDTVTSRDGSGNPATWSTGAWTAVAGVGVGLTAAKIRFCRSTTAVYCLDPSKGLMRSDDNGATFAVVNATFAGAGVDMDNDPASPDVLVISKASSVWLIANAKTTPGTTSQIGTTARFPNAGPIAFDRDSSQRTSGKSRLYVLNNAVSGGQPALYFSDNYGTSWTAAGGTNLGSVVHVAEDMAASNGTVVFSSQHGSLTIASAGSAPTDSTKPTPNPITGLATVAAGITSLTLQCDQPVDPSGIDHVTWLVYNASTAGTLLGTYTSSGNTVQASALPAGTHCWGIVQATDGAATPNTTDPQAARVDLGSTLANPGVLPVTPTLTVTTPSALYGTDTSVDIAIGTTDWDTAVVSMGDPAASTVPLTAPNTTVSFDYGAYSDDSGFPGGFPISVTTTNSTGACATPGFASALLPDPSGGGGGGGTTTGTFPFSVLQDTMDAQIDVPVVFLQNFTLAQQYFQNLQAQITVLAGGGGGGGVEAEVWAIGEDTPMTAAANHLTATLPPTVVDSTKAYAYVFMRNSTLGLTYSMGGTGTGTSAARGTPDTTTTGKFFLFELTLSHLDAGQPVTFTTSDSSSQVMSMVIVGWTNVTGVDGTAVITTNGTSAVNPSPTPAKGSNTAATNEYILSGVGGRSSTGPINFSPPTGVTTYFQSKSNLISGNNVAVFVMWALQAAIGAPSHPSIPSGAGVFSVGSTAALAHP